MHNIVLKPPPANRTIASGDGKTRGEHMSPHEHQSDDSPSGENADRANRGAAANKRSADESRADEGAGRQALRAFVPLCLAGFVAYAYNNAYMTLAPTFAQDIGASLAQAGLQGTVFLVAAVILRFALGPLADRIGTKPVMALGLASFALGSALFALCETFWHILCVRCIQAVGIAAFYPCATAAVAEMSPGGKSGLFLGLYRFVTAASLTVGPAAAFALADVAGYRLCFAALACASLAALAFVLALPNAGRKATGAAERQARPNPASHLLRTLRGCFADNPRLVALVLGSTVLAALGYGLLFSFSATYLRTVGSELDEGVYFTVVGLGGLVANPLAGWLCDRIDRRGLLAGCLACFGLGVAVLGACGAGAAAPVASGILAGLGYAGTITTVLSIVSSGFDPALRSSLLSLQQNAIDLGIACASGAFGAVLAAAGDGQGTVFAAWGALTALAALVPAALARGASPTAGAPTAPRRRARR